MNRGVSLIEVMFSIIILGLGLTSVASLFPTAATIQRQTYDDVLSGQVTHNVRAAIGARGFAASDLILPTVLGKISDKVQPMPPTVLQQPSTARIAWTLHDRCYPSPGADDPQAIGGSHYWVPLVQNRLTEGYRVFVFVLHKSRETSHGPHLGAANPMDPDEVPAVRTVPALAISADDYKLIVLKASELFAPGDRVLTSEGQVLSIVDVTDDSIRSHEIIDPATTAIWYGSRNASKSSTKQILVLDNVVR
jgi:prepilin-type N-terminal cleavage/methylation domain-containing protein